MQPTQTTGGVGGGPPIVIDTAPDAFSKYTVSSPAFTVNGEPVTATPPTVTVHVPGDSPVIKYWAVPAWVLVKLAAVTKAPCRANIATLG